MIKLLRWHPLLLGCLVMWLCGEILSTINGHYGYYPFPSQLPLRYILLGVLVGALTVVWREDRVRQRLGFTLMFVFFFSLGGTAMSHLLSFLSHTSESFFLAALDGLETSVSAVLTGLLLNQVWKWYLKEECRWALDAFFQGLPTLQPYPSMDKLTRILSFSFISLSILLVIASGIPPDFFAPRARNVTITLVPQLISNGTTLALTLPVTSLSQSETQMIESSSDETRPNRRPGLLQIQVMRQKAQEALHFQEVQQDLGVVDDSLQCQSDIHQSVVTLRCQELVYESAPVRAAAVNWLKQTPIPADLLGYRQVGPVLYHVSAARLRTESDVRLNIDAWSSWAYAFSPLQLHRLANQLAGVWENDAYALLRMQKGLAKAWLSTVGQSLPTDPHCIHFQILIQQ
jgi:hypothetical protein